MLLRFRGVLFYIFIAIITIIFFILFFPLFSILKVSYSFKYKVATLYSKIFINLLWRIVGIKYNVIGLDKIPHNKAFLVVANHQSYWENFFFQIIIPIHSWVIKKEIFQIPIFGWGFKLFDPIAIDRSRFSSALQIVKQGVKKINDNISVIIFPEGTRIKPNNSVAFKLSAAKLAIMANAPILLIAHNAGEFWHKGMFFEKRGTVTVNVLEYIEPFSIIEYSDQRALTAYIEKRINFEKKKLES